MKKQNNFSLWAIIILSSLISSCATQVIPTLEERELVRQYSSDRVQPIYILKSKKPDFEAIEQIKDLLENIPDAIQQICNDYGGVVIIFDGKLTDNRIMSSKRGQAIEGYRGITYDDLMGIYNVRSGDIYIRQDYMQNLVIMAPNSINSGFIEQLVFSPNMPLHEYGHMFNAVIDSIPALKNRYGSKRFLKVFDKDWKTREMPNVLSSIYEFFAICFARYYFSDESREELKNSCPNSYSFLAELEKDFIDGKAIK